MLLISFIFHFGGMGVWKNKEKMLNLAKQCHYKSEMQPVMDCDVICME
jgi:hypothetical protein